MKSRVRHYDVRFFGADGVPVTVRVQRNTRVSAERAAIKKATDTGAPRPLLLISCEYVKED